MKEPKGIQLALFENLSQPPPPSLYELPKGTTIWPENSGWGVVQETSTVLRVPGEQIRGLSAFEIRNRPLPLYLNQRWWSIRPFTRFGAHVRRLTKVR